MEVHHHAHTARKKWTHYFWEFFMLFLAITAGFFVENLREHKVEHQREKQYIRSLIQDVKTDTLNISKMIYWFNKIQRGCDTVLDNFDDFTKGFSRHIDQNYFSVIQGFPDFVYTDRTIQQLKNAGGLRLVRNTAAADSIIDYDATVRDILIEETPLRSNFADLNNLTKKIRSYRKFTEIVKSKTLKEIEDEKISFWITKDPTLFEQLYNLLYWYREIVSGYSGYLLKLKGKGGRLIDFLQEEYH